MYCRNGGETYSRWMGYGDRLRGIGMSADKRLEERQVTSHKFVTGYSISRYTMVPIISLQVTEDFVIR